MSGRQKVVRIRRQYNQWVANETLEDYALRFTAKSARKWSNFHVANTALGAISFLACEAIGATITINYGFDNAIAATLAVSLLIFLTGLPIAYYAVKNGVDIDLLTRGAGFGYIGSTITSLVYASFTFIFFAIEAAIMSMALNMCFGIPLPLAYLACSLIIIPIVTHGIRLISWLQMWTQPIWILLQCLPLAVIAIESRRSFVAWAAFPGLAAGAHTTFNLAMFGAASSVVLSLIAQIGEQVDFLRFLPEPKPGGRLRWWVALTAAGPGWILLGAAKIAIGSFLAVLALGHDLSWVRASEPTELYRIAFQYVSASPDVSLLLVGAFVVISQIKINATNSYAGSIAWSNFFSRLTHSHPGRVVWVVFNVALALILMMLGVFGAIERILGLYSNFAVAWIGALVADLVINKPLKLSPPYTEFRRAHLYAFNPVGVGAMAISLTLSTLAFFDFFGSTAQSLAPFIGLIAAFIASPAIAVVTGGKYYLARPRPGPTDWSGQSVVECCICANKFEPEDMAHCPVYAGPICSLCCTLDARCHDSCKKTSPFFDQLLAHVQAVLPKPLANSVNWRLGHFVGVLSLFALVIGITLTLIDFQYNASLAVVRTAVGSALSTSFFALLMMSGVLAWLFVLAQESRRVAEEESARQTTILTDEIEAHERTDAKLQKAKEAAEAANLAKSRYVVSISHEIRAPLNSIFGYAQLLERSATMPAHQLDSVRVIRRSAQHLAYLIDGLLDISKIEAGRLQLYRDEVRLADLLEQLVDMFRLPAQEIELRLERPEDLPPLVYADQSRLSQILINLLSNAIKYTDRGRVTLRVRYRNQIAVFEIEDTGIGIHPDDLARIFEPFERGRMRPAQARPGIGLGLATTKLLTEIMGGEISVSSEVGKGSLFRVKLFLFEPVRAGIASAPERRIRGYAGRRVRVLVADDDPAHIDMMRELLAPLGFVLFSAGDGGSCLERFEQCQPDLLLLDISMPVLDGWEVVRRLRRSGHVKTVIIMISANVGEYAPADAEASLHNDFLLKPIEVRKLLDSIERLLGIKWLDDTARSRPPPLPPEASLAGTPAFARPGNGAAAPASGRLPARHHLETLIELGRIGHVDAIDAKLRQIDVEDSTCVDFTAQLRGLIRDFELKRFMTTLESVRHDA